MNIFRFFADFSHVLSIIILLHKIQTSGSIAGLSFKTQALYALVFVTRYLDVTFQYISFYNTVMKLLFLATSFYTLYLMSRKTSRGPAASANIDTFRVEYLLSGALLMALLFPPKREYTVVNVAWSFSLWLESVAILPQLFMLQRTGQGESLTVHYIFALGLYRGFYVVNWIYRYWFDDWFSLTSFVTGIIQTALYSDFFYIYYTKVFKGKKFELPQ